MERLRKFNLQLGGLVASGFGTPGQGLTAREDQGVLLTCYWSKETVITIYGPSNDQTTRPLIQKEQRSSSQAYARKEPVHK